jgi:hypothetical protein
MTWFRSWGLAYVMAAAGLAGTAFAAMSVAGAVFR